jgi:Integrase core domain
LVHGSEQARPADWPASTPTTQQEYDFLHVAVDDRTRIAYAEAHPDERQETAVAFIGRAINWFADHGITVERVMTDIQCGWGPIGPVGVWFIGLVRIGASGPAV